MFEHAGDSSFERRALFDRRGDLYAGSGPKTRALIRGLTPNTDPLNLTMVGRSLRLTGRSRQHTILWVVAFCDHLYFLVSDSL